MDYSIKLSDDGKYVVTTVYSPVTAELENEFSSDSLKMCFKTAVYKILVDVSRVRNTASNIDNYLLAYENLAKIKNSKNVRLAVLVKPGDHSHDFIETVVTNAGHTCRLFSDKDNAIEWLDV